MSSFFVIEGMNGCGKSTVVEALKPWMANLDDSTEGITHYLKEPGELGYQLLKRKNANDFQRMLAMFANRLQHKFLMADDVERNRYILDRYDPSTFVYQCVLGTVPICEFWDWKERLEIPDPSIYFYLRIDAETAYERARSRGFGGEHERWLDRYHLMYEGYEKFFKTVSDNDGRVVTLDAKKNPMDSAFQIMCNIWNYVRKLTSVT